MKVAQNITDLIGETPLLRINKLTKENEATIYAKLEWFNIGGSLKDRITLKMIEEAEKSGLLKKGKIIIEPTSGNTGISLAMLGAFKGYKVKIIMPESMSIERRKIMKALGAELILVKEKDWRDGAIKFTKELVRKNKNFVLLNQFENENNVKAHYENTGKEILEQMKRREIDVFVAGIGTGGTIVGIGKRLKEKYPKIKIVGVEPKLGSKIEGLKSTKEGYIPPVLNLNLIDEIVELDQNKAFETVKKLAQKEGILVGPSSGAVMYVALKKAKELGKGKIIVAILPDSGEKYLSTKLFSN